MHTSIDFSTMAPSVRQWPMQEALRLAQRLSFTLPAKGYVLFETGYGPSGLPHIGTFGEVSRTSMVRYAFEQLTGMPTKLFVFSDDMDGLRKVPTNVPQQDMLLTHLHKPLTEVPDPFGLYPSFGAHNNAMLRQFLDDFSFSYDFHSATDFYRSGRFDETLLKVLHHYDAIMALMLPSLREERQKSYSAFLPIDPLTHQVLMVPVVETRPHDGTIVYRRDDGVLVETPVTGGHCKLQWKVDWAMRWVALDVDYEMSGKDLIPSVALSSQIASILGSTPPMNFTYELFLDGEGQKISKTKGNGLSVEQWLRYGSPESLSLFMYQKPKTAKRLYFDSIPKAVDDWIILAVRYLTQSPEERLENPLFYIHAGSVPVVPEGFTFQLLLNLVSVCPSLDKDALWTFVQRYRPHLNDTHQHFVHHLLDYAQHYYTDFILPTIRHLSPTDSERSLLLRLQEVLSSMAPDSSSDALQNALYAIATDAGVDVKGWFQTLYRTLLGQEQGPRMGSFIALYGVPNTIALIGQCLNGTLSSSSPS